MFLKTLARLFLITALVSNASSEGTLGSCFRLKHGNNTPCDQPILRRVTKERCCNGHYRRSWASESPTAHMDYFSFDQESDVWSEINTDVYGSNKQNYATKNCLPCKTSCKDVDCGEDRVCIMRNGMPKCICNLMCHLNHKTVVCGSDGKTYSSECKLLRRSCRKKKAIHIAYSGPCQSCRNIKCKRRKSCVLDELLVPHCRKCSRSCSEKRKRWICGSDGISYPSKCHLKLASCRAKFTIERVYKGRCREDARCSNIKCSKGETCLRDFTTDKPKCVWCGHLKNCPSTATNICASDGTNFQSWCALRHASCRKKVALSVLPHSYCDTYKASGRATAITNAKEVLSKKGRGNIAFVPKISADFFNFKLLHKISESNQKQMKIKHKNGQFLVKSYE